MAMVTLNNKASVTIQPPMFGRDDPLSRLRPLPERFREFKLEPGFLTSAGRLLKISSQCTPPEEEVGDVEKSSPC